MTDDRQLERTTRRWLEEGPDMAPDRAIEEALVRIEATPQERGPLVPWRMPIMNLSMRMLAAAVLAVVAVGGAFFLINTDRGDVGGAPSASPSPTASQVAPSPTGSYVAVGPFATPIPSLDDEGERALLASWTTYVSERYDLSISHPPDWVVRPATSRWTLTAGRPAPYADAMSAVETFHAANNTVAVSAWSVEVEPGQTLEEWVQSYCELYTAPCDGIADRGQPAYSEPRDRHPGVLVEFTDDVMAFFPSWDRDAGSGTESVVGDAPIWTTPATDGSRTLYVVAAWRPPGEYDARRLVELFALSTCLTC